MFKKNHVIFALLTLFVVLLSVPVTWCGARMAAISDEESVYLSDRYHSQEEEMIMRQELQERYDFRNSSHPVVAFMAVQRWFIWLPITIVIGIIPIALYMLINIRLTENSIIHYLRSRKTCI